MLLISNSVSDKDFKNIIVRINMAWVKTEQELDKIIKTTNKYIMLDYPRNRKKPPKPILTLNTAYKMLKKYKQIKYFALSNCEIPIEMKKIRNKIPDYVKLVPKIETLKGIENIKSILESAKTDIIMLDKEDLYTDIKKDNKSFNKLIRKIFVLSKLLNFKILELKGVVFIST